VVARDTLTAIRQFSCLPNCPQYCRVTPTEGLPFLGNPCHPRSKPQPMPLRHRGQHLAAHFLQQRGIAPSRIGHDVMQRLVHLAHVAGARRAAIGSTLFRSSGSNKPFV